MMSNEQLKINADTDTDYRETTKIVTEYLRANILIPQCNKCQRSGTHKIFGDELRLKGVKCEDNT